MKKSVLESKKKTFHQSHYSLERDAIKQVDFFDEQAKSINDEIDHYFETNFVTDKSNGRDDGKKKNPTMSTEETEIEAFQPQTAK